MVLKVDDDFPVRCQENRTVADIRVTYLHLSFAGPDSEVLVRYGAELRLNSVLHLQRS